MLQHLTPNAGELANANLDSNNVPQAIRIDSSGYELTDLANGRTYRKIHRIPAYVPSGDTRVIGNQPTYMDDTNRATPTSDLTLVDNSGYVYTSSGVIVYVQTGTGTRENTGTPAIEYDPYRYERLRANPQDPIVEADRFDYNEESISVVVTGGTLAITDKSDNQPVAGDSATSISMIETDHFAQLTSQVTLVCTPAAAGTYTITITDSTIEKDFPIGRVPPQRNTISFTLYVTDENIDNNLSFTNTDNSLKEVDTADAVMPVSTHFDLAALTGDTRIRYQVVKGSGNLYVGTPDREDTTPTQDLAVHKSAAVYL